MCEREGCERLVVPAHDCCCSHIAYCQLPPAYRLVYTSNEDCDAMVSELVDFTQCPLTGRGHSRLPRVETVAALGYPTSATNAEHIKTYVCMYVCMHVRMYVCMYVVAREPWGVRGGRGCRMRTWIGMRSNWLSPVAYCLLRIAYCLLPVAYCLFHSAYRLLSIVYCLSHIVHCSTAYCLSPVSQSMILKLFKAEDGIMLLGCAISYISGSSFFHVPKYSYISCCVP